MAIESVNKLVAVLDKCRLLEGAQLDEVVRRLQPQYRDPRALAKELLQRGWITNYHVHTFFGAGGKVSDLILGQYVLLEKIGEGGMGQVFKARHLKLNRVVALKVVRKEWLSQPQAVQRFHREIRAAAALSHVNIVMAYDADQIGETHFIAMEYVEGVDLGKLLKQSGAVPVPLACDFIRQAALGLQHAHEKGMVHRDIKPSNLLLTKTNASGSDSGTQGRWGTVKILDMGLARIPRPGEASQGGTITHAGAVVGTPDYISPEQARDSSAVDIRADLYSLGCTLYYLLAGQVPFPGGTGMEKLFKHQLEEPQPIEKVQPLVHPALARIVRKLMAKKPEERYQLPSEVATALHPFCHGDAGPSTPLPIKKKKSGIPPPADPTMAIAAVPLTAQEAYKPTRAVRADVTPADPSAPTPAPFAPRRLKKRYLAIPLVGIALLFGAVLALLSSGNSDSQAQKTNPAPTAPVSTAPLTTRVGTAPLIVPGRSPLDQLQRADIPESERPGLPPEVVAVVGDSRLRHWGAVNAVALSPDGRTLASAGYDRVIRLWDLATGRQLNVLRNNLPAISSLAFAPDGKSIYSAGYDGMVREWNLATGQAQAILTVGMGGGMDFRTLALAPDGATAVGRTREGALQVYDLAKRAERFTTPAGAVIFSQAYSTDGKLLAVLTRNTEGTEVAVFDVATGKEKSRQALGKEPIYQMTLAADGDLLAAVSSKVVHAWSLSKQQKLFTKELPVAGVAVAFTPDRQTLLVLGMDGCRQLAATTGQERGPMIGGTRGMGQLALTPDSKTLVMATSMTSRITVADLATGQERFGTAGHRSPITLVNLTNAGTLLTASGSPETTIKYWNLLNKQEQTLTTDGGAFAQVVGVTPDGQTVLVRGVEALTALDVTQNTQRGRHALSRIAAAQLVMAPTGKLVAMTSVNDPAVHLLDVPTLQPRALLKMGAASAFMGMSWSADGQQLLAVDRAGTFYLWDVNGTPRPHGLPPAKGAVYGLTLSPDAKSVVVVTETDARLYDVASGAERVKFPDSGRGAGFISFRFSPDGATLLGWSGTSLRLWQAANGQPKGEPRVGVVMAAPVFAPDGRTMAVPDNEGVISFIDLATGAEVRRITLPGGVVSLGYAPDGRYLAAGAGNGTAYILRLETKLGHLRPEIEGMPIRPRKPGGGGPVLEPFPEKALPLPLEKTGPLEKALKSQPLKPE